MYFKKIVVKITEEHYCQCGYKLKEHVGYGCPFGDTVTFGTNIKGKFVFSYGLNELDPFYYKCEL